MLVLKWYPEPGLQLLGRANPAATQQLTKGLSWFLGYDIFPYKGFWEPCIMLASNLLDIIDDIVYSNCCISINGIYNYRWWGDPEHICL